MMASKFWMVYVQGRSLPTIQHPNRHTAINEAERLARLPENRGREAFVLEAQDYCFTDEPPVVWRWCDEVPF
ncbi:MAG: hypothetical protein HQ578_06860 [Chloroflexi bacterium]|nr:hypothetical protein [Chloroflexota bacterium]